MWNTMGWIAKGVAVVLFIMSMWSFGVAIERYYTFQQARNVSLCRAAVDRLRSDSREAKFVERPRERPWKAGQPCDRGEVLQITFADRVEHCACRRRFSAAHRRGGTS